MSLMTVVRKFIYEVETHYERDSTAASDGHWSRLAA
jgi:hypothetical protein